MQFGKVKLLFGKVNDKMMKVLLITSNKIEFPNI